MFQKESIKSLTGWANDFHEQKKGRKRLRNSPKKNDFLLNLENKYQVLNEEFNMQTDDADSDDDSETSSIEKNSSQKKEKVPAIYSYFIDHKKQLIKFRKSYKKSLKSEIKKTD